MVDFFVIPLVVCLIMFVVIPGIVVLVWVCIAARQMEKTKLKPADSIAPPVGYFDPSSYPKQTNQPPPLNTVSYPLGGGPGLGYANMQGTALEDEGTGF